MTGGAYVFCPRNFTPLCQCLSEETLKAVSPFYLVSYARRSKISHQSALELCNCRGVHGSSRGFKGCHPDMILWLIQRVRNLGSLYRGVNSSLWIVWDVAKPDASNLSTDGVWSHHQLAPAERATRRQGTLLKSAHSLHSLEACNVYTKRVLMQWNGCRDCPWNCESVPNEQQQWGDGKPRKGGRTMDIKVHRHQIVFNCAQIFARASKTEMFSGSKKNLSFLTSCVI